MKLAKYIIAYLPARILFFAGDLVSKLPSFESSLDNEDHFSSVTPLNPEFIWSLYQWLMIKSTDIDDWGETGLWRSQ